MMLDTHSHCKAEGRGNLNCFATVFGNKPMRGLVFLYQWDILNRKAKKYSIKPSEAYLKIQEVYGTHLQKPT